VPLLKQYSNYDDVERVVPGPDLPYARTDYADTDDFDAETPQERYGRFSVAATFFGWLVATVMTVLLAVAVGACATAASRTLDITQSQVARQAETFGLASAITLLVVLMIAYFTGGYVSGRMARFDGRRQGRGVWLLGLLVTILVAVLGARFGPQYDVLSRVDLPSVPIPRDTLTVGGIATLVAVVLGTRLSAASGGEAGQRYHAKVDRAMS